MKAPCQGCTFCSTLVTHVLYEIELLNAVMIANYVEHLCRNSVNIHVRTLRLCVKCLSIVSTPSSASCCPLVIAGVSCLNAACHYVRCVYGDGTQYCLQAWVLCQQVIPSCAHPDVLGCSSFETGLVCPILYF